MPQAQVVAAIICEQSKFLLGKRALHKKSAPGFWSPISGRIEAGKAQLHVWLVDVIRGQAHLKNDEHTDLRWFSISEIQQEKNMLDPDRQVFLSLGTSLS